MSLFLCDAEAGEKVNDRLRFDFELASQLVDSDLIGFSHALRLGHLVLRILFIAVQRNWCIFGGWFDCGR